MGWVRVTFSAVMLIVFLAVRLVLRVALWAARIRQNGPPHVVSLYRVLRLGRSAAQILQNGSLHRALCQLGCAPFCAPFSLCCSVFPAHRPKSSTTDLLFSLLRSLTPFSKCTSELLSGILAHHAREPNAKMQKCTVFQLLSVRVCVCVCFHVCWCAFIRVGMFVGVCVCMSVLLRLCMYKGMHV